MKSSRSCRRIFSRVAVTVFMAMLSPLESTSSSWEIGVLSEAVIFVGRVRNAAIMVKKDCVRELDATEGSRLLITRS